MRGMKGRVVGTAMALALGAGAVAMAAIPDGSGTIHACYAATAHGRDQQGAVRVIDPARGQACASNEAALNWNTTGPRGPQGPAGPTGPSGTVPDSISIFVSRFGSGQGVATDDRSGTSCDLGEVELFAGNVAPHGLVEAAGQVLPISGHDALFELLGTTYGGDGEDTFALPDLRGLGPGHTTYAICIDGTYP